MNAWLKRCVFNLDLNRESVSEPRTLSGRLFQSLGAKYEKVQPPLVDFGFRLQFAQAHQNWTMEDWKNFAWSDESRFQLRHSDGRVRIWRKEHESMDPSCLVSTVQAGGGDGVMVWLIFSWHTLGLLVPIEHCLNTTVYLSIVADHVHPFMTTVYPSYDATSSRIMHHVTKLKSSQTGFLNMTIY